MAWPPGAAADVSEEGDDRCNPSALKQRSRHPRPEAGGAKLGELNYCQGMKYEPINCR
jgi:hypothetical protein